MNQPNLITDGSTAEPKSTKGLRASIKTLKRQARANRAIQPPPAGPPGLPMTIRADGGCSPNPGRMYGSYAVDLEGSEILRVSRQEFGHGTNNEAEFIALERAILAALDTLEIACILPGKVDVLMLMDSKIVCNRISGRRVDYPELLAKQERLYGSAYVDAAKRMGAHAAKCLEPLKRFRSYRIEWNTRERNVENFGH